ncbi:hypothetical protein FB45DRAFT_1064153 [Roridomyces roridus]|uniref:Uncharacterized protein n=1 Tax=Roridomyces roridus TaxID=1738132 RepID=A0AAD7FFP5_9AGAR|nr:hypothetical protein FB45DRAFT_1064153 [Roridomyces roridus]
MSPSTSVRQLMHDFAVCASLSFIIVLGIIHGLIHLLHLYFTSSRAASAGPITTAILVPALRITEIATAHAYLMLVFKLTLACTVLVFALKEICCAVCARMGWCGVDVQGEDVETAAWERKALIGEASWVADVKVSPPETPAASESASTGQ